MEKPSIKPTHIMAFGTFDFFHKGHEHFLKQARRLSPKPYLIVSLARDANVKKIKGKKPVHSESFRLKKVLQNKLVDEAVLGQKKGYLGHIIKHKPQIIALGYDQSAYTKGLAAKLKQAGLKVEIARLKPHKPHLYKSSLMKNRKK